MERPVCFASRTLSKAEKNYATIHIEALAIYWGVKKFYQYLLGTEFILESDHKPLLALFGEEKGIPVMAAGRLQRWALYLSGLNYTFKYIKGSANGGADGLSRLPVTKELKTEKSEDYFNFYVEEKLLIDAKLIRRITRMDAVLSKVLLYTMTEWPDKVEESLKPYLVRKHEISVDNGLLFWGYRVIIPEKFKEYLLNEIHATHFGTSKMKMLARQYFWYPKLDQDLEELSKSCEL